MTPYVPVFCLVVDITHTHNCLSYTNCYEIATFFAFYANFRGARRANCARFWRGKWGRRDFDRIRKWRYVNLRGGESGRDHAYVRGRCGIFFVTYIIFRLTDMQMHNKMEIEGAASDTVRPSAADLRREAGQMRGFHSQSCRFGGENAAEAAEVQRSVNRKEVRDRRNEKTETIRGRARPGAWHGLNCTSRCRSTASCWPCATRWGCARRRHSGTCACCGCGRWTMRRTATYPPCQQGSWRRSASSASAGPATSRWRCARPGL